MVYLVSRREHHCLMASALSGTRAITAVATSKNKKSGVAGRTHSFLGTVLLKKKIKKKKVFIYFKIVRLFYQLLGFFIFIYLKIWTGDMEKVFVTHTQDLPSRARG